MMKSEDVTSDRKCFDGFLIADSPRGDERIDVAVEDVPRLD
jgi:hypothetical protein